MKIIILHGDHQTKSYERLSKFRSVAKKRGWEIFAINNKNTDISEILASQGLFQKNKIVVVEDVNLLLAKDYKWIKNNFESAESTLVVYHKNSLSKTLINKFPKSVKIEEYKLPKLVWTFLDSFYPGNAKNCLLLLNDIIKNDPAEFVFSLLARRLIDLYLLGLNKNDASIPLWLRAKLQRQHMKFKETDIVNLMKHLEEIDIKVKTSKAELAKELDFLIASKLE